MKKLLASLIAIVCVGALTSFVGCSQPAEEDIAAENTAQGSVASGSEGGAKPAAAEPTAE